MKLVVAVICLIGAFDLVSTQATIDFSSEIGSQDVRNAIIGLKVPNESGGSKVKYSISNIKITNFDADQATLSNPSELNYNLKLGGIHLSATADIHVYKDTTIKFFFYKKTVRVNARAKAYVTFGNVHINQGAKVTIGGQGITATPTTCSASIGTAYVKLKGSDALGKMISPFLIL